MSPRYEAREIEAIQENMSRGVVGNVGQLGLGKSRGPGRPMNSVRRATNLIFSPERYASCRPGSRDISSAPLFRPPNSLAKLYASGANRLFAFCDDGFVLRRTGSSDVVQTLPFTPTSQWWRSDMANGLLVAAQAGGVQPPIFNGVNNPAETWFSLVLPKPTAEFTVALCSGTIATPNVSTTTANGFANVKVGMAVYGHANIPVDTTVLTWTDSTHIVLSKNIITGTITNVTLSFSQRPWFGSDTTGGALTVTKDYFYRVRWRYSNGSSKTSTVSAAHQVVAASGNYTILVNIPRPTDGGGSARGDYIGWTLERTNGGATSAGPFYTVTDGTAATYGDGAADSSLFNETDETQHGEPVAMDGVIFHKGRLFGWYKSNLYLSQTITGPEATGVCNWVGDLIYPVGKDDGDAITTCLIQNDRLVIFKSNSTWTLDGDDEFSFRLSLRDTAIGCPSPRGACAVANSIFFFGGRGRLFVLSGNLPAPVAYDEMGEYLAQMDAGYDSKVLAINCQGDFVIFWYTPVGQVFNTDQLVFDLRKRSWTHWSGYVAVDALVQRDGTDFGGARLLFADPRLTPPTTPATTPASASFVAWRYDIVTTLDRVYVQKVSSTGVRQWPLGGVLAMQGSTTHSLSGYATCCSDATGDGCWVIGSVYTSNLQLYAQRLDVNGAPLLAGNGTALSTAGSARVLCFPDGAGGVIVVWEESGYKAQRVNAAGVIQWGAGGLAITDTNPYQLHWIAPDGEGGLFVGWRGNPSAQPRGRVTRVTSAGVIATGWTASGVDVGQSFYDFAGGVSSAHATPIVTRLWGTPQIVENTISESGVLSTASSPLTPASVTTMQVHSTCPDGAGGAFIFYVDETPATDVLYAVRCTAAGVPVWAGPNSGRIVVWNYVTTTHQSGGFELQSCRDGSGGVIVGWLDRDAAPFYRVRVQRYAPDGTPLWGGGVLVSDLATSVGKEFSLCYDGDGGCIVYFNNGQSPNYTNGDLYAQRIDKTGARLWGALGSVINTGGNLSFLYPTAAAFTNAPPYDVPTGSQPSYHVWNGLVGSTDQADSTGLHGSKVKVYAMAHRDDGGEPNYDKDYDSFECYIEQGSANITVTVTPDPIGDPVTLSFSPDTTSSKYDDPAAIYDDPNIFYADEGRRSPSTLLPKGTIGRAIVVELAAESDDGLVLSGWSGHGWTLPRKERP